MTKKQRIIMITCSILVILIAGGGYYYFYASKKAAPSAEQSAEPTPDPQLLIDAVNKQIQLPGGEDPVIATVSDKTQLQNQEFFQDAENGDKVLIYKKAKKAYLYRPSIDKVLAQAPLDYRTASSSAAQQATPSANLLR